MAEGYAKLLSSIVYSSIWGEPDGVVKVWVTMMALADKDGIVHASVDGLARAAVKSIDETEQAIRVFLQPDPRSRSKEEDGRRLREVDGGWQLINYRKIRDMHETEASRARKREWWRKNRGKAPDPEPESPPPDESSESSLDNSTSSNGSGSGVGSGSASEGDARGDNPRPSDPMGDSFVTVSKEERDLFDAYQAESGKTGIRFDDTRSVWLECARAGVTPDQVKTIVAGAKKEKFALDRGLVPALLLATSGQREKYLAMARASPDRPQHEPPQPNDETNRYKPRMFGQ